MWGFNGNRGQPSLVTLGDRARDKGDWDVAVALYSGALARDLRNAPLWVQYGHALKESGKLQDPAKLAQAEAAYRRALIYAPRVADTHLHLGHVLKLRGRIDEAKAAYLRALALDPAFAAARDELRALGWEEGDGTELQAALASLDGVAVPRRRRPSLIEQADAARDATQWALAARCYRAVLDRDPGNAAIWVQYGHALKEAGNLKDPARLAVAEAAYRRALTLKPGIADTHLQFGHVLKLQGRAEEAEAAYIRALALDPSTLDPLHELGGLGWSEGQKSELRGMLGTDTAGPLAINPLAHYLSWGAPNGCASSSPAGDGALVEAKLQLRERASRELNAFLEEGDLLRLPAAVEPAVSILLVLFNQAEFTFRCLRALIETVDLPAEVIIIDNASSDSTWQLLDRLDGARIVRNNENLHFLRAVNQGAAAARGAALLLLNNDTNLGPGAFKAAVETLNSAADIGAVGGKLILPDGTLQEAGSIIWNDGTCVGYGRGKDPNAPEYQFRRDVDYCSGAFLLVRRDLFERLGGLDAVFAPAYYEETDFCMRVRQAGYRIVYDPRVEVTHFEFGSSSSTDQALSLMQRNHKIFLERHRQSLAENHLPPNTSALDARMSDRRRPRLLLIDDQVPFPSYGSGFPRAARVLNTLHKVGCFITHYPLLEPQASWSDVYEAFPREIEFMLDHGRSTFGAFLDARAGYYDIIIVSRPHNMSLFAEHHDAYLEQTSEVRIVYDAEALFSPREAKQLELAGTPLSATELEMRLRRELDLARLAHAVIAVSAREADVFKAAGLGNVHVLGHALAREPIAADFADRHDFLFVGALVDDEAPNIDALFWFVDEVMPHLDRLIGTQYRVRVAGRGGANRLRELVNPRVELLGLVKDLTEHYRRARVFIAPLRFAAGIPHKLHETGSRGLPAVATSLLAAQLGWEDGTDLLVADSPEQFAHQCARLYMDRALWQRLREAALLRVAADCDPVGFDLKLTEVLRSLRIETIETRLASTHLEDAHHLRGHADLAARSSTPSRPPIQTRGPDIPGSIQKIVPCQYDNLRQRVEERRAQRIAAVRGSAVLPVIVSDIDEALSELHFQKSEHPKVSILVPVYNQFKLTLECLLSILRSEPQTTYEIVVADDASSDEQVARLKDVPGIRYFRQQNNLHFLKNCNTVFPHVRGEYLFILNNDAQLLSGALDGLVKALDGDPKLSAAGPSFLYPNGTLQEAGCSINLDASTKMVGLFEDPNLPVYNRSRQVHYSSAAALLVRRDALSGVLFDDRFAPAYCEDVDLCLRLHTTWGPILHVGEARVVHHLSASTAEKEQQSKLAMIWRNQQRLLEKWSDVVYEMNKVRIISFYLPQFHPIPENDLWWGTGFTEWTNVTRAVPSFEGHYQPHLPADLGFYDLRGSQVFEKQARLAARYNIEGFCVYYYRFGARRVLDRPLEVVVEHPEINFRFCICWANENWTRRWDGGNEEVLLAQDYSRETFEAFAADVAHFVQDGRYIRVDGRPLVLIYRPLLLPDPAEAAELIRSKIREAAKCEIHLVYVESMEAFGGGIRPSDIGFDASVEFPPHGIGNLEQIQPVSPRAGWEGHIYGYDEMVVEAVSGSASAMTSLPAYTRYPAVSPSWDNTPRQPIAGTVYHNATPEAFRVYVEHKIDEVHSFLTGDSRLLFINAWNEWAEGSHLEPDQAFGHRWLEAVRGALLAKGCV